MLAAEREYVGRCGELLELLATLSVVGIVIALSMPANRLAFERLRIIEPLTLGSGARIDLHEHLAVNGAWPVAGQITLSGVNRDEVYPPRHVATLDAGSDGALRVSMRRTAISGPGYRLSLRAATMPQQSSSPIVWLCGYADAPASFAAAARNETTIEPSRLPASCRASLAPQRPATP